jgi:acyl-coenzyme A thioesterase PaaI-like protein
MNYLLKLQEKVHRYPLGKTIFSRLVASKAPYFKTIRPHIEELRHNYLRASMKKRRSVENHLGTVHAIASCNLCEFTAGICMEASIPKNRRWIPVGMDVQYLKKAESDVEAICDLSQVEWETTDSVDCRVAVLDKNKVEVVKAIITMKVSDKKKK